METRHIASLSGKDSLAMCILMKYKWPKLKFEKVFVDTLCEHPTTYEFLDKAIDIVGPITKLYPPSSFEELLYERWLGFLPGPRARWCTRELKQLPFERYIKSPAVLYMGLRADEEGRLGYTPPTGVEVRYPLREWGISLRGILKLMSKLSLEIPSRRGCYFCWGQRQVEWIQLAEEYPSLFWQAASFEKSNFTWKQGYSLIELYERRDEIFKREAMRIKRLKRKWIGENEQGESVCKLWCK